MNPAKFLKNEFLLNGHLQSIGAVGLFYSSSLYLFNSHLTFQLLFSVYLIFEIIFIFDRYYDLDIDASSNAERAKHLLLYKDKIAYIILILLLIGIVLLSISSSSAFRNLMLLVLFFGILYPVLFKKITRFIPIFKNIYVSLVYALIPFLVAFLLNHSVTSLTVFLSIFILVEALIAQFILDIKDVSSDKTSKLKTLPVLIGVKNTKIVSLVLTLTSFVFAFNFLVNGNSFIVGQIIVSLVTNLLVLYFLSRKPFVSIIFSGGKFVYWLIVAMLITLLV